MTVFVPCPRCREPVDSGETTCLACGYVRPPHGQRRRPMPAVVEQRAIAAMVLAVLGIVVPFVCSAAAVAYGLRARRILRAAPELGGRRMAAIGVALGSAGLLAWIVVAVLVLAR